ncbi:MAG: redoxin domain-containing protein [Janthinobacterium lividum]
MSLLDKTRIAAKTARLALLLAPVVLLAAVAGTLSNSTPKSTSALTVQSDTAAHKATVYVFLSTQCMVSKVYAPRLNALARSYSSRGVAMIGVFSNVQEGPAEVAAFAKSRQLTFPVVRDADAALAEKYGATMTPQAFVIDPAGAVVYTGRIDDNTDSTLVHRHDLAAALDSVLAGTPVLHPHLAAFGCIIRRPAVHVASSQITYARDVAPILQRSCETCHRDGQIGPMPLTSYTQAAAWRGDIKRYTESRQMPPWHADPGYGDFQDSRRLSAHEVATLAKWADAGAPEGSPKDLPVPAHFHDGWPLGQPDLVLQPSRPYHLEADGADVYRCYVIPTDFTHDRYVSAVDVQPGNRAIVHHVIAFIDGSGASANLDGHEKEPGYTSFGGVSFTPTGALGGWAPGMTAHYLPDGVATEVPAGARIVLQVHYHKDGKPETDFSRIGLYFAKTEVQKTLHVIPIIHGLQIPANDAHYTVTTLSVPSPIDYHLLAVTPHLHLLGRSMKLTAILPDGKTVPLISVSDWNFNWQATYFYKKPLAFPKGTRVQMTATYDNSAHNPRNPNSPPKTVTWGEQTTDEMCIAFLHYTLDREHLAVRDSLSAAKVAKK